MNNINKIHENNLCIGCGICKAVCPKNAITTKYNEKSGLYENISNSNCIDCGICTKVCPSIIKEESNLANINNYYDYCLNGSLHFLNCYSKNKEIVKQSTSGGFVYTIIEALLNDESYDCGFLVDDLAYDKQIYTKKIKKGNLNRDIHKSKYIPVSQYETAKYMSENPKSKVIIVCTSCSCTAINKFIELKRLNRDNYLIIGLFCDKTLNYNISNYFKEHPSIKNEIEKLYFRSKDGNQWPGKVKIIDKNNKSIILDSSERTRVKDFYCPERCLYCIDKLNRLADISVGDNYTNIKMGDNGSNTIIIRTKKGNEIWEKYNSLFEFKLIDQGEVITSQKLELKYSNIKNAIIKNTELINYKNCDRNITKKELKNYKSKIHLIKIGYNNNYKKIYNMTHKFFYKLINKIKNKLW